jgi:hypothetical protein
MINQVARLGGSGLSTATIVVGALDFRRLVIRPCGGRKQLTEAATMLYFPATPWACTSRYSSLALRHPACQRSRREAL